MPPRPQEPVMNSPFSSSWHPSPASLRSWIDDTLNHLADAVKDAMLDWDFDDDEWADLPPPQYLPPLSEAEFLAALRGQTERALKDVAAGVNEVRPGVGWQCGQNVVAESLAELAQEAFAVGLQMRLNAALHRPSLAPAPG